MSDPWADDMPPVAAPAAAPAPVVASNGVEISLTFKAHGGYDAPWAVVKGPINEVAKAIAAKDDGKVSSVLKQVAEVDKYNKGLYAGKA